MDWGGTTTVYVQLASDKKPELLEAALPQFMKKHLGNRIKRYRENIQDSEIIEAFQLRLQPLTDIYLNSDVDSHYTLQGNAFYSYILSGIAFLVLFIACINFMTLSIGRSTSRAMEVGVRKVLGAHRRQVMQQFWGEALVLSFFALILAIGLAELFLPVFNTLALKELNISYFDNWMILLALLGILITTGLVAGSYPAAVLSGFRPVSVFRGQSRLGSRNRLTSALVILQYALSITLMIGAGVMSQQLHFMRTKNLGFNKDQVVVVSGANEVISERF